MEAASFPKVNIPKSQMSFCYCLRLANTVIRQPRGNNLYLFFFKGVFFLRFYLFIFKERGREGEKHQYVVASHVPRTGDHAGNPGMCPD